MPLIELVWDDDCPNVEAARANLGEAMRLSGLPLTWREWRRDDPAAPDYARRAGSPAILVEGRDVEDHANAGHACCRVYVGQDGRRAGAPPIPTIVTALRRVAERGEHG